MKFVIVNDIHANNTALSEFSNILEKLDFDKLIILGDILTYGVDVVETIETLHQLENKYNCTFIKGNHEQIYFDYQNKKEYQYKKFPPFLNESIHNTADKLSVFLEQEFEWVESLEYKDVLFTHANLFDYGDWSYLNTEEDFLSNYRALSKMGLRGAIFGHTHRAKYQRYSENIIDSKVSDILSNNNIVFNFNEKFLLTNGSLGQPRGSVSSFLICNIDDDKVLFQSHPIEYDVSLHRETILRSDLSDETKEKLLRYYK